MTPEEQFNKWWEENFLLFHPEDRYDYSTGFVRYWAHKAYDAKEKKMDMLTIECPNCHTRFDDDMPILSDEAFFECPACDAEITITMTWHRPEPEPEAA